MQMGTWVTVHSSELHDGWRRVKSVAVDMTCSGWAPIALAAMQSKGNSSPSTVLFFENLAAACESVKECSMTPV